MSEKAEWPGGGGGSEDLPVPKLGGKVAVVTGARAAAQLARGYDFAEVDGARPRPLTLEDV